ncbi:MAG: hypothetical protein WAT39_18695 [Planctomycetota bacterium]
MHDASSEENARVVQEYLARVPTDREWAMREAQRSRDLSVDERFDLLASLLRLMDELLAGRQPAPEPGHPFWRHWRDPELGRPR